MRSGQLLIQVPIVHLRRESAFVGSVGHGGNELCAFLCGIALGDIWLILYMVVSARYVRLMGSLEMYCRRTFSVRPSTSRGGDMR